MKNFKFKIQGTNYAVEILKYEGNIVEMEVNGTNYKVEVESQAKQSKTPTLVRTAVPPPTRKETKITKTISKTKNTAVKAPLPGLIIHVLVKEGSTVKLGDKLLTLEAMKMENNVLAEREGIVHNVKVAPGDTVLQDDLLMEIE